jgi:isochorismate synthase
MHRTLLVSRYAAIFAQIDLEHPLDADSGPLSAYWSRPAAGLWAAGYGIAGIDHGDINWFDSAPLNLPGPWFGGWAFDPPRSWSGLPEERWILPELLIWKNEHGCFAAAFAPIESADAGSLAEKLETIPGGARAVRPENVTVNNSGKPAFLELVQSVLTGIAERRFNKVVVAREIRVGTATFFDAKYILRGLEQRYPNCRIFLVPGREGESFVGASPELLCEMQGRLLVSEALAGTSAPDQAQALLESEKDSREHRLTVDGILTALEPFVEEVTSEPRPSLKLLANVAHLTTPIQAILGEGVDPMEVARALHPTPAVAGSPRKPAIEFLRQHEPFVRGWYAGAVGIRGKDRLELAVGLRSARIRGSEARVYAGAGIVIGSVPELEWTETERKAGALLSVLGTSIG